MVKIPFVLASGSPRRKQLLEEAGYTFEVHPSQVEEPSANGYDPEGYVAHTAWLKANSPSNETADLVLAADTVASHRGAIIGKPMDRDHAFQILSTLQGTEHYVLTGVCLRLRSARICLSFVECSTVVMKPLSQSEIDGYLDTGLWEGKAGAYGIQDHNDPFVQNIAGSYTNVMGLPMERMQRLFLQAETLMKS